MRLDQSDATKKVPNRRTDCFRDPHQGFNGDDFLPSLNFAEILWIEFGLFRQFLLGEPGTLSLVTNRLADDFPMPQYRLSFRARHSLLN